MAATQEFQTTAVPHDEVRERLDQLDLDCIKFKLMDSDEGKGWDRQTVDELEKRYKRFLFLTATQGTAIVPSKEIDEFWHAHILDTHKYATDCERVFGFFVHHFPYFGMRGDDDAQELQNAFETTKRIYAETFGEPYGYEVADCENCGNCGSSCGVCSASGKSLGPDFSRRPSLTPA